MKYTIEDLANGVCSLKNDGTEEELQLVLDKAFPKDDDKVSRWNKPFNGKKVVKFQRSNQTEWVQIYENTECSPELPMQSCAVFLDQIKGQETTFFPEDVVTDKSCGVREFASGATRNSEEGKLDYNGFLSPLALEEFAKYMHKHRVQENGVLRDSDNWQKGIPVDAYMSSMWRHFFDTWKRHRGLETPEDQISNLCGVMFNVQGMLHELLKTK